MTDWTEVNEEVQQLAIKIVNLICDAAIPPWAMRGVLMSAYEALEVSIERDVE